MTGAGGAVASISQVSLAGEASRLPTASTARTANVCVPSARPVYVIPLEQAEKPAPSRLHSKPATPLPESVPLSPNVAVRLALRFGCAPSIEVSGATASTVHDHEAGVGSTFPRTSIARTAKVWPPLSSPL